MHEHGYDDQRDERGRRIRYMENPLKNLPLQTWPDILLAVCAVLCIAFVAGLSSVQVAKPLATLTAGLILFGIGGIICHYRFRDVSVKGNRHRPAPPPLFFRFNAL